MAEVQIDAIGQTVEVPDEFLKMSPEEQDKLIGDIITDYNANNAEPTMSQRYWGTMARRTQGKQSTFNAWGMPEMANAAGAAADYQAGDNNPAMRQNPLTMYANPFEGGFKPGGYLAQTAGDVTGDVAIGTALGSRFGPWGVAAGIGASALDAFLSTAGPNAEAIAAQRNPQNPVLTPGDVRQGTATSAVAAPFEAAGSMLGLKVLGRQGGSLVGKLGKSTALNTAGTVNSDAITQLGTTGKLDPDRSMQAAVDSLAAMPVAGTMQAGLGAPSAYSKYRKVQAAGKEFGNDPDQVASDLRVGDMFDTEKKSQIDFKSGHPLQNDVVFANVMDNVSGAMRQLASVAEDSGVLNEDQHNAVLNLVKRAAQHNRAVGMHEMDTLTNLGLPEDIDTALRQGLRDLETVVYNKFKKNKIGPFERMGDSLPARAVGATAGGAAGSVIGTTVGQPGLGFNIGAGAGAAGTKAVGRTVDRFLGLQEPPFMRRLAARRDMAQQKGLNYGDTLGDIQKATQDAILKFTPVTPAQPGKAGTSSARRLAGWDQYLIDSGVQRQGGWMQSIVEFMNAKLPPDKQIGQDYVVDVIRDMASKGLLPKEDADIMIQKRGGKLNKHYFYNTNDSVADKLGLMPRSPGTPPPAPPGIPPAPGGTPGPAPGRPPGSGILNPLAYAQTMRNVEAATKAALDAAPDDVLKAAVTEVANARSKSEKAAVVDRVAEMYPESADYVEQFLRPLTEYGPQGGGMKFTSGIDPKDVKDKLIDPAIKGIKDIVSKVFGDVKPGEGVTPGNNVAIADKYRVRVERPADANPKGYITLKTNPRNAQRNLDGIDEVMARFPNPERSPGDWATMVGTLLGTDEPDMPPYGFIAAYNDKSLDINLLKKLTPGMIAGAKHGLKQADAFKVAYETGQADVRTTGALMAWSFLSRGVSPYVQESMFMDIAKGVGPFIKKAAAGNFTIDEKIPTENGMMSYTEWASTIVEKNAPGAGSSHNLNGFGRDFLTKMSAIPPGSNKTGMEILHDLFADPDTTQKDIRRAFLKNFEGVGIDMKVLSFSGLVVGKPGMVLDRVQVGRLWNDGRFPDTENLYDENKVGGKAVTGTGMAKVTFGARGLATYEAIERALENGHIEEVFKGAGIDKDFAPTPGAYHWLTWIAHANQEASHGTLTGILRQAQGKEAPFEGVYAKEGQYDTYQYGAEYTRGADNKPQIRYNLPDGDKVTMSTKRFAKFRNDIKKASNGIVPKDFKVSDQTEQPWYLDPAVNRAKLKSLAVKYGRAKR